MSLDWVCVAAIVYTLIAGWYGFCIFIGLAASDMKVTDTELVVNTLLYALIWPVLAIYNLFRGDK